MERKLHIKQGAKVKFIDRIRRRRVYEVEHGVEIEHVNQRHITQQRLKLKALGGGE